MTSQARVEMGKRTRPRLGLILYGIDYSYQESILRGADEECRAQDADLICFAGGGIALGQPSDATYAVIEPTALDGLLLTTSTLGAAIGSPELATLLARFREIPICSLGYEMADTLSVVVDGNGSVQSITQHLVNDHGRRRLAFIQGNNHESDDRRDAFLSGLRAAGLVADPRFIFEGNFRSEAGEAAVERLRQMQAASAQPEVFPVDGIVAANDWMALGALQALEAHGVRVPEEVSVVGFDDIDQARFEMPSLTTIRQPSERLGAEGVRALLAVHRGEQFPRLTRLPTELKLRKSCGCFSGGRTQSSFNPARVSLAPYSEPSRLAQCALALEDAAPSFKAQLAPSWSMDLARAFTADLSSEGDRFASLLERLIRATARLGNVAAWHYVVTTLRKHAARTELPPEQQQRLVELVDLAQVLVSSHAERVQGARRLSKEALLRALTLLSEDLRTASSYGDIAKVLERHLPRLDVPSCVVSVHEGALDPDTESEIVTFYERERGLVPSVGKLRAGDLLPPESSPARRGTWVFMAATFERQILGYCRLEISVVESGRYSSIAEQVGLSLNAVRLLRAMVEEMTRRERAERERLESEIAIATRIQAGILPRSLDVPGLQVATAMHAATEVGGDYFDVLPTAAGAWFAIGDVAGHGLPAGLVMLMIQSIVASLTAVEPNAPASHIWGQLNRVLYQNVRFRLRQDEHATLTLLRYTGKGQFEFAGAHEDILIQRGASGAIESVETPGIWAGIMPEPAPDAVRDSRLSLSIGDTMLLFTDGIIEARNEQGEMFGGERLCQEFARVSHLSVQNIVEQLLKAVHSFMQHQQDDITLVVVRYVGT